MLNHDHFYHGCLKNIITIFGAIFSEIHIKRSTGTGNEYQEIKVPLTYAPKQRAIVRIKQNPNIDDRQAQITLPRMAFEIVSLNYDAARKINTASITRQKNTNTNFVKQIYSPTPYDVHVNLYAYAKNQEDALQMVEQIFPFFNPDLNVSINVIPEMNVVEDIPIILDSVSYEDDYEGDLETRRAIIWTLSFTVKMNFYGPITTSGVIKKVNINVSDNETDFLRKSDATLLAYNAKVDPLTADVTDVHTIQETFTYGG